MTQLTHEEKIDYIYKNIKAQNRNRFLGICFKLAILLFIVYSGYNFISNIDTNNIQAELTDKITDITAPIVNDLVEKTLDKEIGNGLGEINTNQINTQSMQNILKNNPDILKQLQNK